MGGLPDSRCPTLRRWQIVTMCNTYVARPKRGAQGLAQRVSEAMERLY